MQVCKNCPIYSARARILGCHSDPSSLIAINTLLLQQHRTFTPFFSSKKEIRRVGEVTEESNAIIKKNPRYEVIPLQFLPLSLIEEFIPPPVMPSAIELITTAWTEERAQSLRQMKFISLIVLGFTILLFFSLAYSVTIAGENKIRGRDTMPHELKIGSVVYLDISENGQEPNRITIGLLTDTCPIYCEYFHRMCCGLGRESLRGQTVTSTLPEVAILFGDGTSADIGIPDFDGAFLPREDFSTHGSWRGAVSSIPFSRAKQSGNFCFHMGASSYAPQIFGVVVGGYGILERISGIGALHSTLPKKEFQIVGCGELCTLEPTKVVPIPWDTYSDVSLGFDTRYFENIYQEKNLSPLK